jgi:CelD/BcsL family acetyltransferase involved in cellulose biosynthesis
MAAVALSPAEPVSHHSGTGACCEVVGLGWLEARAAAWDHLVAEAATPNPFYVRRIVAAHGAHGLAPPNLSFVVVHRGDSLLALLPFKPRGARLGLSRRAHAGWITPYIVTSTPLIARQGLGEHAELLLDGLRAAGSLWLLPLLSLESDAGAALQAAAARREWPSEILSTFGRAVLEGAAPDSYESHVGKNRRKDLARRHRRLAELGHLRTQSFPAGESLRRAVEDFLTLEARGWKGAGGTALASRPETAAFLRAAFADSGGPVSCRADVLSLDERPIAISLAFLSGGTAYLFKTAYDESLRRYAPGVLLEDEIVRIRRETGFAGRLNSASMPGSVLDTLYPHREQMGDLIFATDPAVTPHALAAWARQEALRRQATEQLKGLYRRLRAACHPTSAKGLASVEAK